MKKIHAVLKQGDTTLETWIDDDERIKVGTVLTLKGETGKWRVATISEAIELPASVTMQSKKFFEHDDHHHHKGLGK